MWLCSIILFFFLYLFNVFSSLFYTTTIKVKYTHFYSGFDRFQNLNSHKCILFRLFSERCLPYLSSFVYFLVLSQTYHSITSKLKNLLFYWCPTKFYNYIRMRCNENKQKDEKCRLSQTRPQMNKNTKSSKVWIVFGISR